MNIYIYRLSDHEYDAGLGKAECESRGTIVETWPLNSPEQAKFLASHGTRYLGASEKVSAIADSIYELMTIDETFRSHEFIEQPQPIIESTPMRLSFYQRVLKWFYDHLLMAKSPELKH